MLFVLHPTTRKSRKSSDLEETGIFRAREVPGIVLENYRSRRNMKSVEVENERNKGPKRERNGLP